VPRCGRSSRRWTWRRRTRASRGRVRRRGCYRTTTCWTPPARSWATTTRTRAAATMRGTRRRHCSRACARGAGAWAAPRRRRCTTSPCSSARLPPRAWHRSPDPGPPLARTASGYTTRGSPPPRPLRIRCADGATDLRAAPGAEEFGVSKCRRSILNGECHERRLNGECHESRLTRDAWQIANKQKQRTLRIHGNMGSCCTYQLRTGGGLGHGAKGSEWLELGKDARSHQRTGAPTRGIEGGRLGFIVLHATLKAEKGAGGVISACMKNGGAQAQFAPGFAYPLLTGAGLDRRRQRQGDEINRPTETLAVLSDQPKIRLMVGGRNAGRQRQRSPCMARVRCHLAWLNVTARSVSF
jgi:hypothetical protein